MKKFIYTLSLVLLGTLAQAQVKIGANPGSITPGAVLDIEGSTTSTRVVSLTNGSVGIGTTSPNSNVMLDVINTRPLQWISGVFSASATANRVVLGTLNGTATVGGHAGDLSSWQNLAINPGGGNVGIGTSSPSAKLEVAGSTKISGNLTVADGTQGANKVLTSDANGSASWVTPYTAAQVNFFASFTGSKPYSTTTVTTVDFDVANPNIGGGYNVTTDEFTAPVSGVYYFTGSAYSRSTMFNSATPPQITAITLGISVNGTPKVAQESFQYITPAFSASVLISYLVRLNQGDKVKLLVYSDAPSPALAGFGTTINAPQTNFQGFLLAQ